MSYEKTVEQLQKTVKSLESGELSLEQSLKEFEAGIALVGKIQEELKVAEQRVELLTKVHTDGSVSTEPLAPLK